MGAPRTDRDDRREPRSDQVAEQLELELLERETGGEAVQRDPSHPKHVLRRPPTQERRKRDGEVCGERRVAAVAEVEDPGDPAALVDQEVVEVEVAVHDLAAQALPLRQHALLVAVEHARDERPPCRIGDLVEQRAQARRGTDVPEQLTAGGRVEERTERQTEAGVDGGDLPYRCVVELGPRLPPAPPLEQPHLVTLERRSWREHASHRQVRIDGRDVGDRGLLEVEHGLVLVGVRDLEDSALEHERLVALAAERGGGAVDAEHVCRDPRGLFHRELRRRRVEDGTHAERSHAVARLRGPPCRHDAGRSRIPRSSETAPPSAGGALGWGDLRSGD